MNFFMRNALKARNSNGVNFYRVNDNFGYIEGQITFSEDCSNNLVFSDESNNKISNLSNSLIIIQNGNEDVYSIKNVQESYERVISYLNGKEVRYNIPNKVFKRENLTRKSPKDLENLLLDNYNFLTKEIREIKGRVKNNGVFQVSNGEINKIFKYFGDNKTRIEAISKITEKIYPLFPLIERTNSGKSYVPLKDGLYILEEFVEGNFNPKRDSLYFSILGETSALMHNKLLQLIKEDPSIGKELLSDARYLSESNLISLAIDLSLQGHSDISSNFQRFEELKKGIESLPDYFIHGDLNSSNVVETSGDLRFIDLERIKKSKRILEFESPLIFAGNMETPIYVPESMKNLIEGYNKGAPEKIKDPEKYLTKMLLEYSLIKNFVVRNIRRKEKENTKENLLENLFLLGKEEL